MFEMIPSIFILPKNNSSELVELKYALYIETPMYEVLLVSLYLLAIFWCYKEIVSRRSFSHFILEVVSASFSNFLYLSFSKSTASAMPFLEYIFLTLFNLYCCRDRVNNEGDPSKRLMRALSSIIM